MIRKLKSGGYRLYSRKTDPKTGRRRNLGTFKSRAAAEKHERAVQYFKRHGMLPDGAAQRRRPFGRGMTASAGFRAPSEPVARGITGLKPVRFAGPKEIFRRH